MERGSVIDAQIEKYEMSMREMIRCKDPKYFMNNYMKTSRYNKDEMWDIISKNNSLFPRKTDSHYLKLPSGDILYQPGKYIKR